MKATQLKAAVLCSAALTFAGCKTTMTNSELGTMLGGAVGALAGNQAAGSDKAAWTAVGAVAGAFIGNQIGRYLDERDRKQMAATTRSTLETGQSHTWTNSQSHTRGQARVVSTDTRYEPVTVKVHKDRVSEVPPLDIIGQTYRAERSSNLRGGPGTDYAVVGKIMQNEAVNVVGKVKGADWYLVSHDGVGSGFVYAPLLRPAPEEIPDSSGTMVAERDVTEQEVSTSKVCRTVEQTVTLADGSSHSETIEACKGPNGWVMQG